MLEITFANYCICNYMYSYKKRLTAKAHETGGIMFLQQQSTNYSRALERFSAFFHFSIKHVEAKGRFKASKHGIDSSCMYIINHSVRVIIHTNLYL